MAINKPAKAHKDRKANKLGGASQLKSAVRALGGDDQDLELLQGIGSDEETAKSGKKGTGKAQVGLIRLFRIEN